ncbi:MAG: class I SAM-dependent methyltransferase [Planctomycetota bacterium]
MNSAPPRSPPAAPPRTREPARLPPLELGPCPDRLDYSVRRYFVDEFFERAVRGLPRAARVVDVGGSRSRKRGQFDLRRHDLRVTAVNADAAADPHLVADAGALPLASGCADAVLLGEVVEHLLDPHKALREAARVLVPGGMLLATAPFLFRVHDDPIDVARYTPHWWHEALRAAGFAAIDVEQQGMLPSVLAELLRGWCKHLDDTDTFWPDLRELALPMLERLRSEAHDWERRHRDSAHEYVRSFATGYGIRAVRA